MDGVEAVEFVKRVLWGIGLDLEAEDHVVRRADGSAEAEADLVYTTLGHTFVVEVSTNAQREARRIKRRKAEEWAAGDRLGRLAAELGLPPDNAAHVAYVDLSGHAEEGDVPALADGVMILGEKHVEYLEEVQEAEAEGGGGIELLLCWAGH